MNICPHNAPTQGQPHLVEAETCGQAQQGAFGGLGKLTNIYSAQSSLAQVSERAVLEILSQLNLSGSSKAPELFALASKGFIRGPVNPSTTEFRGMIAKSLPFRVSRFSHERRVKIG